MKHSFRRWCVGAMTAVMTVSSFPAAAFAQPADATASAGSEAVVQQDGDSLTIGNDQISRTFSTDGGKLETERIDNKRAKVTYDPAEGSEEFIFRTIKGEDDTTPAGPAALDRTGWTATADSEEKTGEGAGNGLASCLLDGNLNTIWHTAYRSSAETPMPHWAVVSLNGEQTFQCFSYTPRQNGESTNGNILGYELYASNAEQAPAGEGTDGWELISSGELEYNGVNPIYVNLDHEVTARHVKLVATSNKTGTSFAGGAEFNLHAEKAAVAVSDREFKASDLELKDDGVSYKDVTTTFNRGMVNERTQEGVEASFEFEPITLKGVEYTITEHVVMYDGDHYMRKFLEISVPQEQAEQAAIDSIDLESLKVDEDDTTWTIPTGKGGIVQMDEFKANLGQPIYVDGMFLGCEFPETDTEIKKDTGYMRYYSGKTFSRLVEDNQAGATDDGTVTYNTWQTVAGAARSTDNSVIQSDFYDYIDDIATPSDFRTQYNSWFDNMMRIDDENILDSFMEVNKQLEAAGAEPLDSYVVDDGWNNYNDTSIVDAVRSGTTLNETGFWEFNSKFPEGLTPSSSLVKKLGSEFGVWVGPRGGYNFYSSLADILVKSGKGSKAGWSIDVADREYVKNFADMAVKWQQDYGVNYWKWDGFADQAQYNTWSGVDGEPGYANRHMVGGFNQMYHVTDLWEAWIDLFEQVRVSEVQDNVTNLWISLTCYVNPSPWFLQWANSVWLQCTHDQNDAGSSSSKMDRQLTYRDACYYDFIQNHEFQFPLANIYNHDPVYGKEGTGMNKGTATDVQFANYLYTQASRGTAFWELYYSESMMTPGKWQVTAEFLKWAEENNELLRNAKMFGGSPNSGTHLGGSSNGSNATYGFSGFSGEEGLVMFRNPATSAQSIDFTFDATNGVAIDSGTYDVVVERVYNPSDSSEAKDTPSDAAVTETTTMTYGETYSFNLQPDESITLRVTKKKDAEAPKITSVTTDGSKTVTVKFDKFVKLSDARSEGITVEGAEVEGITASADRVTFDIALKEAPKNGTELTVKAGSGVADIYGNGADSSATVTFRKGNKVASAKGELSGTTKKLGSKAKSLAGNGDFSVSATVTTQSAGAVLATQADGYTLGIDAEGHAYVTLNGATATSTVAVNDGAQHEVVAEKAANGILKVYVDGALSGSVYSAENAAYEIPAGQATIGSAEFTGTLDVTVYDHARGYDGIAGEDPSQEGKIDASEMTATAIGGTSEGDIANIFDGDDTTFWTSSEFADGIQKGEPAVQVDLGHVRQIDRVSYTKRYYDGPANQWKCTGNARQLIIEYSEDGETWKSMLDVDTTSDEQLDAKGNGGTWSTSLTAPVSARYIRVSGGSSYHWKASEVNKFFTVGDLSVYEVEEQEPEVPEVDKSELSSRIDGLNGVDTTGKTAQSVEAFKAAIAAAQEVLNDDEATQEDVEAALESLKGLEDTLVDETPEPEPGPLLDAKEANLALIELDKLVESEYTAESWKAVADARDALVDILVKIGEDPTVIDQAGLDELVANLRSAMDALVKDDSGEQPKPDPDPDPDPSPDPDPDPTPDPDPDPDPEQPQPSKPDTGDQGGTTKPGTEGIKPGTGSTTGGQSGKDLPRTGDDTALYVAGAAAAGVVALGAGAVVARRRRRE